jgi:hypothetical protein
VSPESQAAGTGFALNGKCEAVLDQLVALERRLEEYRAAVHLLEVERDELRVKLRLLGWTPPAPKATP